MKRKINTVDWSALDYPKPAPRVVSLNRQRPEALEGNRTTQFAKFDWSILDSPPRTKPISVATIVRKKPRPSSSKPQKIDPAKDAGLHKTSAFTNLYSLTTQQIEQAATELKTLNDSVTRNGWNNQAIPLSFDNILQKHPWSPTILQLGPLVQQTSLDAAINLLSAQSREDANWKRVSAVFFREYYNALQYLRTQTPVAVAPQVNAWPANIPPVAAAAVPNRLNRVVQALSAGTVASLFTATLPSAQPITALQAVLKTGAKSGAVHRAFWDTTFSAASAAIPAAMSTFTPTAISAAIPAAMSAASALASTEAPSGDSYLTSAAGLLGIIMAAAIVGSVAIGPIRRSAEAVYGYLPSPLDLFGMSGSWDDWETGVMPEDIVGVDVVPTAQIEEVVEEQEEKEEKEEKEEEKKIAEEGEPRVIDPAKHSDKDELPPSPRAESQAPLEEVAQVKLEEEKKEEEKKKEEEAGPDLPPPSPRLEPQEPLEEVAQVKLEEEKKEEEKKKEEEAGPDLPPPSPRPAPQEPLEEVAQVKLEEEKKEDEKTRQEIKDQATYEAAQDLWERRKMLRGNDDVRLQFANRDLSNAMSRFEPKKRAGIIKQIVKVMEEALEEAELPETSNEDKESLVLFLDIMLAFTEILKNQNLGIEKFKDQLELIRAALDQIELGTSEAAPDPSESGTSEAMSDIEYQAVLFKIGQFPMAAWTIEDAEKVLDVIKRGEKNTRFRLFDTLEELVDIKTRDLQTRVSTARKASPQSYKELIAENNDALLTIYEELKRSNPTVAENIVLNKIPPLRAILKASYGKTSRIKLKKNHD